MNIAQRARTWLNKYWSWDEDARGFRFVMGGRETSSGEPVTPDSATRLVTVWACVSLLADMDAMAPTDVLRKLPDGTTERLNHPVAEKLNWEPNPEMTAFDYTVYRRMSEEIYGNFVAHRVTTRDGRLLALWPLPWPKIEVLRRDNLARTLYYRYTPGGGMPQREFEAHQVVHHRGRMTRDGVVGVSPIEHCAEAMGVSLATEKYGAKWFRNGAKPSLLLTNKGAILSEKAEQNLLDSLSSRLAGNENAHKIGLIQGNFDLTTISISPEQSQFLETRGFNSVQIAQLFRIPPHLIGLTEKVTSWGSGIAELNTAFLTITLGPRFVAGEKQDRRSLLTDDEKRSGIYIKRNVAALLRVDIKSRYEAYKTAIDTGFATPNDIRKLEDQDPAPGLDHYRFPLNTAYFDEAGQLITPNGAPLKTPTEPA